MTLRDYLVEKTEGTAVDITFDIDYPPEALELHNILDGYDETLHNIYGSLGKELVVTVLDHFSLHPGVGTYNIEALTSEFYQAEGFEIDEDSFHLSYRRDNVIVGVNITKGYERVLISEIHTSVRDLQVDMTGYESLDDYLGEDFHVSLKESAKEIFELGLSVVGEHDTDYQSAFTQLMVMKFDQYYSGKPPQGTKLNVSAEIDPLLMQDFLTVAYPIADRACYNLVHIFMLNASANQIFIAVEKLMGSFVLGFGGDLDYLEETFTQQRKAYSAILN